VSARVSVCVVAPPSGRSFQQRVARGCPPGFVFAPLVSLSLCNRARRLFAVRGTITAPGDFTSCRDVQLCVPGIWSHCNVASGELTFQSGIRLVTVFISAYPSMTTVVPVVCQLPGTTTRALWLKLFNLWAPAESVRGYGQLFDATGLMSGVSSPLKHDVYADTFDSFSLLLQSRT
jgi:hypothetical protein